MFNGMMTSHNLSTSVISIAPHAAKSIVYLLLNKRIKEDMKRILMGGFGNGSSMSTIDG